ncbi:MAG: phage protease [Neptuniibacter sp.]
MKTNRNLLSLAVLATSTTSPVAVASLSLEYDIEADGWCQLLPAGYFKAVDGRPHDVPDGQWFINEGIAERLISDAKNRVNNLLIDYEHQTLNADSNGQPAPAAGWIIDIEWREGSGLWIKPKWTARAKEYIQNDEYRYLSAVFPYNTETGEPLSLHSAGLVNRAGIDGMASVEALSTLLNQPQQENPAMNELMQKLLAKLGIELGEGDQLTESQATAALSAMDTLQAQAKKSGDLETQVAALSAKGDEVDLTKWVPAQTYNALAGQMAALKTESDESTVDQLIATAQQEGKILAAEEDYYNKLGKQHGVAALTAALDNRAPIAALTNQQTTGKKPEETKTGIAALSAQELEVCQNAGISPEDYLKNKGEK